MDLIGNIKYVENRPGGRKPDQGRNKPAKKNFLTMRRTRPKRTPTRQPSTTPGSGER